MTRSTILTLTLTTFICLADQNRWYPHEGGLMKYRVQIRFGEEADTMPDGCKFGRVSAVALDSSGLVMSSKAVPKATP